MAIFGDACLFYLAQGEAAFLHLGEVDAELLAGHFEVEAGDVGGHLRFLDIAEGWWRSALR